MRITASTLAFALIISAPGVAPYEAAARTIGRAPAGIAPVKVGTPVARSNAPMTLTAAPAMLATPAALPLKAAAPVAAAPAASDARPASAPTALAAGSVLQPLLQSPAAQGALEGFYSSGKLAPAEQDGPVSGRPASEGPEKLKPALPINPTRNPDLFPPRSSRMGIGPRKFVYWNAYYKVVQWLNLKLARDPNRRVSWDKWPTQLGLLYLIGKIRYVRSGTITDPYDYASNDIKPQGAEPAAAKTGYTADGSWAADRENARMGAENTRFGSNIPPKKVRPDVENMTPSAREAAKLRWRRLDENGKPIVKPAGILNNLAGGWIQFQFHNFGGNTKRDPIDQNPHKLPREKGDKWPEPDGATVDRTTKDPTRVTDNGRPTIMNERTQSWIQAQIYGTNEAEQARLRSNVDGKFLLDQNGNLPEDPTKPGIDLTGFANNYNPLLSFLHWAFVKNHNFIAEHLKKFNPSWDDETLFQQARKINVANAALIHTVEWTEDLLQHPTLQAGMHAEFYGLMGPKVKAWLMRFSYRHPWFAKLIRPVSSNDVIWGMPGSSWEHHDGPFQVPKHFRMVYRLHEMILEQQEMLKPGTGERLDRIELIDFVHNNTRPIVEKFGYDVLGWSFVKKSAGALELHNFPSPLNQFRNQQNGQLTDLAELDLFRERTDGTGTYNDFRRSVGEPPVTSFLELTGGDAELAREISLKYEGDVNKVDAGIGILAEPKPEGFALGFTQFYQFVLNAPRRVKSNRHLTEYFTHKDYTFEGMEWVLQSGGMGGVIARAMKGLPHGAAVVAGMEGVTRWFAPWPDAEDFPVRMLDKAEADSGAILKATLRTAALGSFAAFSAWAAVAISSFALVPAVTAGLVLPALLYYKRMLAWRYMQKAWQGAHTDRRRELFPTLFKGEKWARSSADLGRWAARAAMALGGYAAWTLFATNPIVALMAAATALSAHGVIKATAVYSNDLQVLEIALQNRLRDGYPTARIAPSDRTLTALERRYQFLIPRNAKQPVATFRNTYRALAEHGLGKAHAFKTAALSHLIFGPRTQRGLPLRERRALGLLFNPFAIYVPNMFLAQGPSTTRIYAGAGNAKGLAPGDVDLEEFDKMFSTYAPGRDYMTAYDFARMGEGVRWRASREGIGNPVMRFLGKIAIKHRTDQLLQLYGDVVANEDKHLVPAISRDMLLRVYQGTAQADIAAERALDGVHPDLRAPRPAGEDGTVQDGFLKRMRAKYGWKAAVGIGLFFALKGFGLYILLPWLLLKGIL